MVFKLNLNISILKIISLIIANPVFALSESHAKIKKYDQISSAMSDKTCLKKIEVPIFLDKNAIDDAPITICSNTFSYNQQSSTIIYQGNVIITQIKGINIQCIKKKQLENKNNRMLTCSLWESNNQRNYQMQQLSVLKMVKSICKKQKGCRFLVGQQLKIVFTKDNKEIIDVSVKTDLHSTTKFYSLPFEKNNTGQLNQIFSTEKELYAEGEKMNFNLKKNILTIKNSAYIKHGNNQFLSNKILYDIKNGLITIPDKNQYTSIILKKNTMHND